MKKMVSNIYFGGIFLTITRYWENLFFIGIDSEAHIVRGLLSILQHVVNSRSISEIINLDGKQILREIGLENNITSQRINGFLSALDTVKSLVNGYERN